MQHVTPGEEKASPKPLSLPKILILFMQTQHLRYVKSQVQLSETKLHTCNMLKFSSERSKEKGKPIISEKCFHMHYISNWFSFFCRTLVDLLLNLNLSEHQCSITGELCWPDKLGILFYFMFLVLIVEQISDIWTKFSLLQLTQNIKRNECFMPGRRQIFLSR